MRVLIAYGSKRGGTQGIAERVGEAIARRGVDVTVRAVEDVRSVAEYDAVVVGGALYAMRWPRSARRFVRRERVRLQHVPVWFFSSGPLDDSAREAEIPPVRQVRALMTKVGARGHATFGGRLTADAKGFPASAMAKTKAGDWRDDEMIDAWAVAVADVLLGATAPT